MATFFLVLIIILFLLAVSDLVVGVSNDAVNFLNSAVGSRAASFKIIMAVAAVGIMVGATFSSGMMEVARKGIFHPEYFYFSEIIVLFLAVMVTDVILLDTFNTFGLPTSTTVSIVFELLGAAVALSLIKIFTDPNALHLYEYINSAKALAIISGILISVVIAFTCGALIQYVSRLLFSFDYEKRMKQFGPIWAGMGITAITYFILIKGLKGSTFTSGDFYTTVVENTNLILLCSFFGWVIILYALDRLFKVDILQVLVLIGTFALAMAFAGNDLVNFIGVPIAGYNSYMLYQEAGQGTADSLLMDGLAGPVATPTFMLLLAGVIMAVTLYVSKKARSVLKTSVDLGRQDVGEERFSSFILSRSLVRNTTAFARYIRAHMPQSWLKGHAQQFDQSPFMRKQIALGSKAPAFDRVRASVTLAVASILIAVGTNLKLPLSTTYVTFMVFMGASLADGAWGRESAVYRVSGVLSVVGGWFFTAFSAFIVSFLVAMIFYFGGIIAIVAVILFAGVVIYRTHRNFNQEDDEQAALDKAVEDAVLTRAEAIGLCARHLDHFLGKYGKLIDRALDGLGDEDLSKLHNVHKDFRPLQRRIAKLNINSSLALDRLPDNDIETGHLYILIVDYLEEMSKEVGTIVKNSLMHVDNSHKPLLPEQIDELKELHKLIKKRFTVITEVVKELDRSRADEVVDAYSAISRKTRHCRKNQIKRIKNHAVGTRNSILYFGHVSEFRNLALFGNRIVKVFDDLILNPAEIDDFEVSELSAAASTSDDTDDVSKKDPDN